VLRNELRKMLAKWDTKLAHTRNGEQARLLDMLPASAPVLKSASYRATLGAQRRRTQRGTMTQTRSR
jgi:hypothetical protein